MHARPHLSQVRAFPPSAPAPSQSTLHATFEAFVTYSLAKTSDQSNTLSDSSGGCDRKPWKNGTSLRTRLQCGGRFHDTAQHFSRPKAQGHTGGKDASVEVEGKEAARQLADMPSALPRISLQPRRVADTSDRKPAGRRKFFGRFKSRERLTCRRCVWEQGMMIQVLEKAQGSVQNGLSSTEFHE